jgi:hypothetical protein
MSLRKPLNITMDGLLGTVTDLAEGNPGALNVIMLLLNDNRGFIDLLSLDDMNIRGPQIWIGYSDYCERNIEAFRAAVRARDPELVECINSEYADEQAVVGGASSHIHQF